MAKQTFKRDYLVIVQLKEYKPVEHKRKSNGKLVEDRLMRISIKKALRENKAD